MKKILILITLFLIMLACFPLWLPGVGQFLVLRDQVRESDSLVLLRGEDFFKMNKAIDLHRKGYAKRIIICTLPVQDGELWDYYQFKNRILGGDEISPKEFIKRALRFLGLEENAPVEIIEAEVSSTYDEAVAIRRWMTQQGLKSMLLVTEEYHSRRALMIFQLVFRGTGIAIYPVVVNNPQYEPRFWWRHEDDVKRVLEEYVSLVFNLFYHFVFNKTSTSFDTI